MIIVAIIVLLFILLGFVMFVVKSYRDFQNTRIFALSTASECGTVGGVGVSILCACPKRCAVVTSLLDTAYPTSEVIVVINPEKQQNLMAQIELRYSLFRLNSGDVRLYKSDNDSLERLTVVTTTKNLTRWQMLDMAAEIAKFDYLLCTPSDSYLLPFAAGRIAEGIAAVNVGRIECVTTEDRDVFVVSKRVWSTNGGFVSTRHPTTRKSLHIAELLSTDDAAENAHCVLFERARYNFPDFLALKIMKYRNKVLSLVKP